MPRDSSNPIIEPVKHSTRVLRLRIKDKHAKVLRDRAMWVNQVWNYCNDLQQQVWRRERRFLSGYDFAPYTKGAAKEGVPLHSQTIQGVAEEYAVRRKQCKKVKLRWRISRGAKRSLGWIPFKASALRYRHGQVWLSGLDRPLSLWDSYGLNQYDLGAGSLSEDARGRWYINITVKVAQRRCSESTGALGWVEEIDEAYSTQDCSACGARSGPKGLKELGIREWVCPHCSTTHHRDRNAAKNILRRGRATLAVGITVSLGR